jgi:hypothetical protein
MMNEHTHDGGHISIRDIGALNTERLGYSVAVQSDAERILERLDGIEKRLDAWESNSLVLHSALLTIRGLIESGEQEKVTPEYIDKWFELAKKEAGE